VEFRFGPKEHSLQVSAKSAEKSGHGEEWVKKLDPEPKSV
jgi:hypothetical protein